MKITCQSCQAKYTIADEKVVGKTVKIKCKKCGAAIVVNANEASAGDAHGHEPEEDDGATRVFSGDPATEGPMAGAAGGGPDWTVNVADDDQRTMSSAQTAAAFAAGTITGDTYVWRDGMADWQPLSQVAELRSAMAAPAPAPVAAAPVPPPTDDDLNATVAMNPDAAAAHYGMAAPAPAPAAAGGPTAARKAAAGRGAQDLFGGGGGASPFDAGAAGSGPGVSPLQKSLENKAVGERNENSVLFSLASLTATEKAAAAPDLGPSKKKPARSGLDDIMSMGGGGGMGAGMLAPPPIMAPVIEPPPQQIVAPTPAPMPTAMGGSMPPPAAAQAMGMGGGMISIPPPAQKKTPVGLIIGIVVGVLALGGVGVFLATSGGDKEATGENGAASASVATTTTTAAPTNTATEAPKPTETVAANNTAATNTAAPAGGDPGATKTSSGGTAPAGTGTGKPTGTAATAATTSTPATPPPTATATAETPPAGGGAEFNRAAASSALFAAAGAAKGCKKADGPTGQAKVKVTFAPSGNVTTSQVQGAPFAGTPVGGCIAAAFRSAKVPPFEGSPVSVSKSVTIN